MGIEDNDDEDIGGIQAVDTAVKLLIALVDTSKPLSLKAVAERSDMPPPKAHRYMVSFCRGGLAKRDPISGGYQLGPLAVRMGLTALRHLNVVQVATPTLTALRDELDVTAGLAVWGTAGPTFVHFEETTDPLTISGRPGSILPLLSSSAGRVFGAYLPRSLTEEYIRQEMAGKARPGVASSKAAQAMTMKDVEALFEHVRTHRLGQSLGELNPGMNGLSAPLFDHSGSLVGVINLWAPAGKIDAGLHSPVARALTAHAEKASRQMGWG